MGYFLQRNVIGCDETGGVPALMKMIQMWSVFSQWTGG